MLERDQGQSSKDESLEVDLQSAPANNLGGNVNNLQEEILLLEVQKQNELLREQNKK